MKEEKYIMSEKSFYQATVCQRIEKGAISINEGAQQLSMSYRNMLRILKKYHAQGPRALVHKSYGAPSNHRYPQEKKMNILSLIHSQYKGYSAAYISELLLEEHAISISAATLRRWIRPPSTKVTASTKYRARRPRMRCFGRLIQGDGSFHHWFGEDYPPCCLLVLIDDATNTVKLRFAEQEYAQDMLILLHSWVKSYGLPVSLYFDKRNAYVDSPHSQRYIPHVCNTLGIEIINANTPQAKGRVERANRTLQDRLVKDLARHSITSIHAANQFLDDYFIPRFNSRFSFPPQSDLDAHVPLDPHYDIDSRFARPFVRTLNNDWTFTINASLFQVLHHSRVPALSPRKKIVALLYLDNSFKVFYNKFELAFKEVS